MKYKVGDRVKYFEKIYTVSEDGNAYAEDGAPISFCDDPWHYELVESGPKENPQTHEEVEEILQAVLDGTYDEGGHKETCDSVNHPSHYGQGKIEAIDYIEDILSREEYIGYLRGNIAKYSHRWRYKGGVEDLEKSRWYLDRLIETMRK